MIKVKAEVSADSKGRRYRGVSEDERRTERKQRFIEAGLAVFADQGYHNSTVRTICANAGLTERYFYESFANSEDLLVDVYAYTVDRLREVIMVSLAASPKSLEQVIERVLNAYLGMIRDDPRLARMLFVEVLGVSARIDALYRQAIEEFAMAIHQMSHLVIVDKSTLPDGVTSDLLALGLVGSIISLTAAWQVLGFTTPQHQLVATIKHIIKSAYAA